MLCHTKISVPEQALTAGGFDQLDRHYRLVFRDEDVADNFVSWAHSMEWVGTYFESPTVVLVPRKPATDYHYRDFGLVTIRKAGASETNPTIELEIPA